MCTATLQALYNLILLQGAVETLQEAKDKVKFTEACLVCKCAFTSRAAWACHASTLHGYRAAASILADSDGGTLCRACGKCFSKFARLRRRLLPGLVGAEGAGAASEREPPLAIDGILTGEHSGLDPAAYSKGLLDVLSEHPLILTCGRQWWIF